MKTGTAKTYRVLVRDWWQYSKTSTFYVNDKGSACENTGHSLEHMKADNKGPCDEHCHFGIPVEPYPGAPRRTIARRCTEEEARAIAMEYNKTHKPGWRSRKAEFESE